MNDTKHTARQDSPGINVMPPTVFYSCLLTSTLLELFVTTHVLSGHLQLRILVGFLAGTAGFAFMMWGHTRFKREGTGVRTNRKSTMLITDGAHGISRNPMYVGGSLFYLGVALAIGSLWMLVSSLPLVLYLALYVVPREEAYMERCFGEEYLNYKKRVRRWL